MTVRIRQLIGGEWVAGDGDEFERRNPARPADIVAAGAEASSADVERAVASARRAQQVWSSETAHARGAVLRRASEVLGRHAAQFGQELAREEGKTLPEGIGEVRRAAQILDYVGSAPDRPRGHVFSSPRPGEQIVVTRRPVGTVGVITPFNFPIAIPAWKIAPALIHGNSVVWKTSGSVPLLAVRLAEVLLEGGLPPEVLQLLHGDGPAGRAIVEHAGIDAISFTGSTSVGRSIAAAGAARGIPVQAEMGGKNAAVVLDDADLDVAAQQVAVGAFASSGQKCTATSRLILQDGIADEFAERLAAAADALVVGDPLADGVDLGPLVTARARENVLAGVAVAQEEGARRVTRRDPAFDDGTGGHFVAPVLVDDVQGSTLWSRELFGPVLAMRRVADAHSAFDLVNRTEFGLSAAVFTSDLRTAMEAAERLDVGMLHINSETAGADPHVPFGGVKGSSLGPGEQGEAAQEFYSRPSTVYVRGVA